MNDMAHELRSKKIKVFGISFAGFDSFILLIISFLLFDLKAYF